MSTSQVVKRTGSISQVPYLENRVGIIRIGQNQSVAFNSDHASDRVIIRDCGPVPQREAALLSCTLIIGPLFTAFLVSQM